MKFKLTLVTVLAMSVLAAAGCGGGDSSSDNADDEAAITALIERINTVTADKDAQGFCAVMQPSGVESTFNTQANCVKQTKGVLAQAAADSPKLEIDDISIDGDQATVDLKSDAGGAPVNLVKEGGKWYVPLAAAEVDGATGTTGG